MIDIRRLVVHLNLYMQTSVTVYPPPEASQPLVLQRSVEFWDKTPGNGCIYIVVCTNYYEGAKSNTIKG